MVDRIGQKPQAPKQPWDGSTQVDSEAGPEDFYSANPQQKKPQRQSAYVIPNLDTGATLSVKGASADAGNPAVQLAIYKTRLKSIEAIEKNGKVKSLSENIGIIAAKTDLMQKIVSAETQIKQQEDADTVVAASNLRETKRGEDAYYVSGAVEKLRKLLPKDFPEERAKDLVVAAATMESPESARTAFASAVTAWRQEKSDAEAEKTRTEEASVKSGRRAAGVRNVWDFAAAEFGVGVGEDGPDWGSAISEDDMAEIGRYAAQVAGGTMEQAEARTIITNMAEESINRQRSRAAETGSTAPFKEAGEREGRLDMSQSRRASGLLDEFEAWSEKEKPEISGVKGLKEDEQKQARWVAKQSDKMNSLLRKWGLRPNDRIMESVRTKLDDITGASVEERSARMEAAKARSDPMAEFLKLNEQVNTPEKEARAKEVREALEQRPSPLEQRIELFREMFGDTSPGGLDLFNPGGVDPAFAHKPGMESVIAAQEANVEEEMASYGIPPEATVAEVRDALEKVKNADAPMMDKLTVLRGQFVSAAYAPVFQGVPWAAERLFGSEGRQMADLMLAEGRRRMSGQNELGDEAYSNARSVLEKTRLGKFGLGAAGFAGSMLNIRKGSPAGRFGSALGGKAGGLPATLAIAAGVSGQGAEGVAQAAAFGAGATAASKAFGAFFGRVLPSKQGEIARGLRGRGAGGAGFASAGTLVAGLKGEQLDDAERILLDVGLGMALSRGQVEKTLSAIKPRVEGINERVERFKQEFRDAWAESRRGPGVTVLNQTPNRAPPAPALGGGRGALPSGMAPAPAGPQGIPGGAGSLVQGGRRRAMQPDAGGPAGLPGAPVAPGLPAGRPALGRGPVPLRSRLAIPSKSGLPIEMGPGTEFFPEIPWRGADAPAAAAPRKTLRSRVRPKAAQESAFVDTLSEGAQARAQATLDYEIPTRGISRRELVDTQIKEGAFIEGEGADRRFVMPDGRSVGQKTLTKTGMDYAQHLLETARPKADAGASAPDRVRSIQMGEVAPHEMTRDEFSRGEDLPVAGPGEVILYHRLRSPDQLPSVLEHGLDIGRKGKMSEGPRGVMWYATEPTGYSDNGTVVGVRVPKSDVDMRNYGSGQAAMGRGARPDEIVYVDSPTSSSKSTPSKRVGFERSGEYANQYHETYVEDALKAGETVPPNVLKDYPELAAKYGKPLVPDAAKARSAEIDNRIAEIIKNSVDGGGLTKTEGAEFSSLVGERAGLVWDSTQGRGIKKVEGFGGLSPDVIHASRVASQQNRSAYVASNSHAGGAAFDSETAVDGIMRGRNPDITAQEFYDLHSPAREMLRSEHGDSIKLWRVEGLQKDKPTKNYAMTKEGADQYGPGAKQVEVPTDNVIAVNVPLRGKYSEIIVGTPPATAAAKAREDNISDEIFDIEHKIENLEFAVGDALDSRERKSARAALSRAKIKLARLRSQQAAKPVVTLGRPKRQGGGDPQRHGIAEFVRRQGGFRDERHYRGEIDRIRNHPFLVRKEGGPARSLSDATADAIESGYLPKGSTGADLVEAIENDLRGESNFSNKRDDMSGKEQFPEEQETPELADIKQQYEFNKGELETERAQALESGDKSWAENIDKLLEVEKNTYERRYGDLKAHLSEKDAPVTKSRTGPKSLRSRLKNKPSQERGAAVGVGDVIDVAVRAAKATGRGMNEVGRQLGRAFLSRYESLGGSGPGGKVASKALMLVEHTQDIRRGAMRRPYEAAVEAGGDKKNRETMLGMMRPRREPNSNFAYLDFRRKYEGKMPATPEEKVILDKFRDYVYGTLGDAAEKAKLTDYVNRPDRLPNLASQRYHQILRRGPVTPDGTPRPDWKAIEDMYTQQPEIGTRDNAVDYMMKLREKLSAEGSGALDREAMFEQQRHIENLPAWVYTDSGAAVPITESNPIEILRRLHDQGAKRLGFIDVMGQKIKPTPKVKSKALSTFKAAGAAVPVTSTRLLDEIRRRVIREGGNINLFEDMVRAAQGGRLVQSAGESGGFNFMESSPGRVAKAMSGALKASALGKSWLAAVSEVYGPATEVFGPVHMFDATIKSMAMSLSERRTGVEDPQIAKLRDNDVLRKRMSSSLISRGSKTDMAEGALQRLADVELEVNLLGPVSRVRNYTNYAIAGDNWLDSIKRDPGGVLTQAKNAANLQVYGRLSESQAKQMAAGNFTESQKYAALRQMTRNMSGQDQSKLAKSGVESTRPSKLVAFINYATTQIRTEGRWAKKIGDSVAGATNKKPGWKADLSATLYGWAKHVALRGAQGAGYSLIAHMLNGGDLESFAKRWRNNPSGETFAAVTTSMFAGSYGSVAANFLRERLTADNIPKAAGEAAVNAIWAYGVTRDIWNATTGDSAYKGMGVIERAKALALRYSPQVKLIGGMADAIGITDTQSQEANTLNLARREMNRYRFGVGPRNYTIFKSDDSQMTTEEKEAESDFQNAMARVARGVRAGDSEEDVINDFVAASNAKTPRSAAASIRTRRILATGQGDNVDRFGRLTNAQRDEIMANLEPGSPWFAPGVSKKSIMAILAHDARLERFANMILGK